jgi:hypothetical protein
VANREARHAAGDDELDVGASAGPTVACGARHRRPVPEHGERRAVAGEERREDGVLRWRQAVDHTDCGITPEFTRAADRALGRLPTSHSAAALS